MKLQTIHETTMFHGTQNPKNILKTGLILGLGRHKRDANYLGSLRQALAYGKYIIEVDIDNNEDIYIDEDALLGLANPDDPNWVNQIKNLPPKIGALLHKIAMQYGGWEPGYSDIKLIDLIRKYKLQPPTNTDQTSTGNIAIPKNIGFKGPTKITAIYHLEKLDNNRYGDSQYQVAKILYGTGTLQTGNKVTGSNEKLFS